MGFFFCHKKVTKILPKRLSFISQELPFRKNKYAVDILNFSIYLKKPEYYFGKFFLVLLLNDKKRPVDMILLDNTYLILYRYMYEYLRFKLV